MTEWIPGEMVKLGGLRHVFVATQKNSVLIEFKSQEGSTTRLCLSEEAAQALASLLPSRDKPFDVRSLNRPRLEKERWQVVPAEEA